MLSDVEPPPRVWTVFATYVVAIAAIFALSGLALAALVAAYPDVPQGALLQSLPGLLAGSLASSTALVLTVLLAVRPSLPAALRLVPGRETPRSLGVMVLGILALGQALDSAVTLAGLADTGSMVVIRRALEGAVGPEVVAALVVIGLVAGTAEEIFFRGYMQTRLGRHWGGPRAVLASSACFAVLHVDASGLHVALALVLSAYLGFVTEIARSVLPAVVCHVANNVVYTLQTAYGATIVGRESHAALGVTAALTFAVCVAWLARRHGVSSA